MASHNFLLKPIVTAAVTMVTVGMLGLMSWTLVTVQLMQVRVAELSVQIEVLDEKLTAISEDTEKMRTRWQFVP